MEYVPQIRRRKRCLTLNQRRIVKTRRNLRDVSNPFNVTSPTEFHRLFKLNKLICKKLVNLIRPHMNRTRMHGLSCSLRILCAIRFLVAGCYQRPIGQDFFIPISQRSLSKCIDEVCLIIESKLALEYVQIKLDSEENLRMKEYFYNLYGFPGVIGIIDATHIAIRKPDDNVEHAYYASCKGAHTKNVQIVCDANLKIINVNARYGGSAHDSYVWDCSIIKQTLSAKFEQGERNAFLLGDSAYPQLPWLMTPFMEPRSSNEEAYNISHKKTRSLVDRCIGVLKSRFRCLSRQRILMCSPQKSGLIINACATLHNIMLQYGVPLPPENEISAEMNTYSETVESPESIVDSIRILTIGKAIRDDLAKTFM